MLFVSLNKVCSLSFTCLKSNTSTLHRSVWLIRLCSSLPKSKESESAASKSKEKSQQNKDDAGLEKSGLGVATSENSPYKFPYKKPKLKFVLQGVEFGKYTHVPIPYPKTGGRGWDGKVFNRRMGGGAKQKYRMVDYTRNAISETEPLVERVLQVRYDPLRSADIALVSSGNHKRWILAGEDMKKGDLVKSYAQIPELPVSAKSGDAHPLGALPVGSVVHNIEKFVGEGGLVARAAGTCGTIINKLDNKVIVKMPSKREMCVSQHCVGTVGRVSNIDHNQKPIGSAARNRWFGVRPKSGLWHKKTGYHGRKIRPPKPMVTYEKTTQKPLHEMFDT